MKLRTLFLGLTGIWLATPAVAGEHITIAADEWCPYNCRPGSDLPGFMIEIAREAFKPRGIEVDYVVVPWSRAISDTRQGKYDAIVGATTGDAPDFVFPAAAQGLSIMGFYTTPEGTWEYTSMKSLDGITFGAIADYSYSDAIDAYIKKNGSDRHKVQIVSGEKALEMNVKKLRGHRIDALIDDSNVLANYLAKSHQEALRSAGFLDYSRGYEEQIIYVAFGPKNPKAKEYARIITEKTEALRKSGKLATILAKYGVKDWYPMTKK